MTERAGDGAGEDAPDPGEGSLPSLLSPERICAGCQEYSAIRVRLITIDDGSIHGDIDLCEECVEPVVAALADVTDLADAEDVDA